jgi:flagellar protein FlgJ
MAINPPSDIVLDVLRAADPVRVEAATQRLNALGNNASGTDFATVLDATAKSASAAGAPNAADMRRRLMVASAPDQKAAHAQVEFEASILNSFVGQMMPKDASAFYGEGQAGDIWKSMLSDQIAHQIAKSGQLGIAKRLFATHPLPTHSHQGHGSLVTQGGMADATQSSANPLSMPSSAEDLGGAFSMPRHKTS